MIGMSYVHKIEFAMNKECIAQYLRSNHIL